MNEMANNTAIWQGRAEGGEKLSKQRKHSSHQAGAHRGTDGEQRQAHVISQQIDKEKNNIIEGIVNVTSASCYRREDTQAEVFSFV